MSGNTISACPHGYRKPGDKSLYCRKIEKQNKQWSFCGNQYFCRVSGRWEAGKRASECPLRKDDD